MERTFVLIKPDAVKKNAIGRILARFEEQGLRILRLVMRRLSREEAESLYSPHRGKDFFPGLVEFITSGPVVGAILEGEDAVGRVREIIGPTDPREAPPGSIRAEWGESITRNAIHASDSPESVEREARVLFGEDWREPL